MLRTDLKRELEAYLQENESFYLDLLRRMVAINSFTANGPGVDELGQLTASVFESLGFRAETVQSVNPLYGHHLVLTREGGSGRKIGLVSHLDTVFPADEEIDNDFAWRVEGDRIYGPGTVDIKGGTVLIYMMMAALQALAPDVYDDITWIILFDASEEADGEDFGRLCVDRLAGDTVACLVFEAGFYDGDEFWVVAARKGMAVYQVRVEGKASHAGSAHPDGANAVVQMAEVIQKISGFTDYDRQLTFNVGMVAGGTVTNRVPHLAVANLEMRAFDAGVYDEAMAAMMALNGYSTVKSSSNGYPCRVSVELVRRTAPWPRNEATDWLLAIWQETAVELGARVVPEERGGLSDGNHFWGQLPTIDGLGPSGGNAHCSERSLDGTKDQEYVLATSLVPKALLNTLAVLRLVEGA